MGYGLLAMVITWLILAAMFVRFRATAETIRSQIIKRKKGIKMGIKLTLDTPITVKGLVDECGKDKAAMIIEHQVRQTIVMKQRAMRKGNPVYRVLLKDPIAGKLIIKTDHVLRLEHIGEGNKRRDWFTAHEVDSMRRIMPGFDKYYEVRRVGFDNE